MWERKEEGRREEFIRGGRREGGVYKGRKEGGMSRGKVIRLFNATFQYSIDLMGLLTLGAHAQRGLLYLVCVSVCVSVSTYSRPTGTKPAHQRYQRL